MTATEEPQHIKDLRGKVLKIEQDVEKRREYLHLDDVLVFKSVEERFADRPLRFKKLRFADVMRVLKLIPKIEPIITVKVDEKTGEKTEIETWPELTAEEATQYFTGACQGLALASADGTGISEFNDLEPVFVVEAFQWLVDASGYSAKAVEDFEWFRSQAGRATSR